MHRQNYNALKDFTFSKASFWPVGLCHDSPSLLLWWDEDITNKPSNRHVEISGVYMDVSKNRGIPKSSILIGFSIINHPFWGAPIFENTHIYAMFG